MIRASAPGSIMITGEHAVVYGHRAMVAAIEQRVQVSLAPRSDRRIRISSEIAPPLEASLDGLAEGGPYRFVLAALALWQDRLPTGFDLEITSQIDPTLGLGSSAAVTIACLAALAAHAGDSADLHAQAHGIILQIQGRGSGADLAASLKGGLLAYRAPPDGAHLALPAPPQLSLRYAGYKTPTAEVLAQIAGRMTGREAEFDALYGEMSASAEAAIGAATTCDWTGFAAALNHYQTLMERLGVSDGNLDRIIAEARQSPGLQATKISGSGLGDCVLALGPPPPGFVPVELAREGLILDA
ncbi:MAG: hypothetical protein OIF48_11185 [Silicimonas sp.]|nr:hypothetical protein [Silicimonas sp.]